MHEKFDNCWVEYRDPVDSVDCPSNIEFGLCWYQKAVNKKQTYNLSDHLMVDTETMIAVVAMT